MAVFARHAGAFGAPSYSEFSRREFLHFGLKAAALLAMSSSTLSTALSRQPKCHDLIPAVLKFLRKHCGGQPCDAAAFEHDLIAPHQTIFDNFVGRKTPQELADYIVELGPLVGGMQALHQRFADELPAGVDRFRARFPDFTWSGPVILMVNLFQFDAGTGPLDEYNAIAFGLDTIVRQYGPELALPVLISHELFHVYHDEFHPWWRLGQRGKNVPLYRLVWQEGLAAYMSGELNPPVQESQILFSPTLEEECRRRLRDLASSLSAALDHTDRKSYCLWMGAAQRDGLIPPRAGYYLGQQIAAQVAAEYTPEEMVRLPDAKIRRLMQDCLLIMQRRPGASGTSFASNDLTDDGGGI
ncbi:MAG TPA: hypothetical protein VFB04_10895 [Terriglobales bacterium]|nr:hypothetical protein [Terriglobales bacterium]